MRKGWAAIFVAVVLVFDSAQVWAALRSRPGVPSSVRTAVA
jgi:hypothetical protein